MLLFTFEEDGYGRKYVETTLNKHLNHILQRSKLLWNDLVILQFCSCRRYLDNLSQDVVDDAYESHVLGGLDLTAAFLFVALFNQEPYTLSIASSTQHNSIIFVLVELIGEVLNYKNT
jgi:hypothetical protein